jgi:hypothetical protein
LAETVTRANANFLAEVVWVVDSAVLWAVEGDVEVEEGSEAGFKYVI